MRRIAQSLSDAGAGIAILLCTIWFSEARASARPVFLGNSIKPVAAESATTSAHSRTPFISRTALAANEAAAEMTFEVALKMRNFAELQARVGKGEHVSPQEMATKYEPLPTDYQAVVEWLSSQGLSVTRQDSRHISIFVRGSVSQIGNALQVTFARVTSEGKEYTSAISAPAVPATISSLLVGINGLQPHIRAHRHAAKPNADSGSAVYSPSQIAQAYQASGLYSAGINGAGQTIAIVIDTFPAKSDLVAFWNAYGINQSINNIQFIQAVSGTLPATTGEETLDTEWSSAIAPGAKVRVYATTDLADSDLDQAYVQILDDATNHPELGIHQMSMSYGLGETYYETEQGGEDSQIITNVQDFILLTNAGVTCFASAGDDGSTPNDESAGGEDETGPVQVEYPACDPNVIGVGGTTLMLDSNNNETSEVVWNSDGGAGGGGTSIFFARPSWQKGTGVPAGTSRLVPDISCAGDPNYAAGIYYTDPTNGVEESIGGTSWSVQICGAFCALINQARENIGLAAIGHSGSQMGALLYPYLGTNIFRDITSGNNATPNSNGLYAATTGYDEASGIGAPLMQPLAAALAGTQTLVGVSPQSAFQTVNQGQNATFAVTANGSPASYKWQSLALGATTWSPLSDNSVYSGSSTASLTVTNTTTAMSGTQFQCVVTYTGTGALTSNPPSFLVVETPWVVSTLAGDAGTIGFENNTGTAAQFGYPTGVALDSAGNLYVTDLDNNVIRKVTPAGVVTTPYGSLTGASGSTNGTGNNALFSFPRDITIDSSNNLYVSDEGNNLIRKINISTGQVTSIGGSTAFSDPKGIGVDSSGNVYVADSGNNVIRKIATSGAVSIFAGSSTFAAGYHDGTGITQALFNQPIGLTVDKSGNVYVTDYSNEVIRKITSAGVVSTLAGQAGISGCLDGTGTQALFNVARGIVADSSGNLYVTDSYPPIVTQGQPTFSGNNLLRKITPAGVVTTLAGQAETAGINDGEGSAAQFYNPCGLAFDASGDLYIADASNNIIRKAVLEPTVSVAATQPNASVVGPITGQFTVTRTGSTASSLTVNYSLLGTAVNGTDYTTLAETLTIPAGASSATITLDPIADPHATTNLTVQLTLTGPTSGLLIGTSSATVTIAEIPASQLVPYSQWETNHSFSGLPTAAPLNDKVPNLLKYLYDIDPSVSMSAVNRGALPKIGMTTSGGIEYLTLTYHRYLYATGVTVKLQTSTDLVNWTTVDPPDLSQIVSTDSTTGDPTIEVGVIVPSDTVQQFVRLNVSMP